jgi:hypothetical protein
MNRVKRALVEMLVAALVLPTAAVAQEPSGSQKATPAAGAERPPAVRLTFEGRRPSNPWAVFGYGPDPSADARPGGRVSVPPVKGTLAARPRLEGIEMPQTVLAKNRLAAKRGAGQSQPLCCGPGTKTVVVVLATIACIIVVALAEAAGTYQWPARR